jgi:thiol-disulfide isomerase/thioredoxin
MKLIRINHLQRNFICVLIIFFSFTGYILPQSYKIDLKLDGLSDTTVYLAYHFGNKKYVRDTIKLDYSGNGTFSGKEDLPGGIYLIVLPGMNYFEILVSDSQQFGIETTVSDPLNNLKVYNSPENILFNHYQRFMAEKQSESENLQQRMRAVSEDKDSVLFYQEKFRNLDIVVKNYWNKIIQENPGSLMAKIIKGMMNVEIPDFEVPDHITNKDSLRWVLGYNYNQKHFFDNIDFSDERLLRTPVLHNRIEHYFTRMIIQSPDSIIPRAIDVIEKSRANEKVYQYVLVYLLNHYETSHIMGLDEVFVRLAEEYYLSGKAPWASQDLIDKLSTRVQRIKPNLIGRVGADLRMQTQQGNFINLYQVDANYVILYFYEPGCGHCKTVTPQIFDIYKKYKNKGVEVFAVYILDDREEWIDYTTKNNYNWINVYDPSNASFFRHYYDIYSTPAIYMLDKNKKIIAKRIGAETVEKILQENIR